MKKFAIIATMLSMFVIANGLELPNIISDNAVLQQNSEVKLWGWSEPNQIIVVSPSWMQESTSIQSDKNGKWEVYVQTPTASFNAYSIIFDDGKETQKIKNILIGEVWFCSGQSNMEMPLRGFWGQPVEGAAQAIAYASKYKGVRVVTIPKKGSYTECDRVEGVWKESTPENAHEFSAVGYYFATSLSDMLNVPIGIISCAYGGSKIEGWIPQWKLDQYDNWDMDREKSISYDDLKEWERIGVMYNAMLKPIIGYTIKGFLWNQGESNVGRHKEYPLHQKDMVEIWRNEWNNDSLPFYFVELPAWKYGDPDMTDAALFRECQHYAASIIPYSGIVSTTDLVYPHELEDIHACKKKEIGERLAFMAAGKTYGLSGVPYTYPSYKSVELSGNKVIISFDDAYNGLNPNMNIEGFEVAGDDRVFYPAEANEDIQNLTIIVTSNKVQDIKAVRYCFHNFAIGTLKDLFGMPLIPFRTDEWDNASRAK